LRLECPEVDPSYLPTPDEGLYVYQCQSDCRKGKLISKCAKQELTVSFSAIGLPFDLSKTHQGATQMRSRARMFAHILERLGLAMAGAACGLFVGAHVGSTIPALTSQAFLLLIMISGAMGFYLGIDTPPPTSLPDSSAGIDTPEFLGAVGTFLAALTAFTSVGIIILRREPHVAWAWSIMTGWVVGVAMQMTAGAIARARSRTVGG
jgi:hypothetical protein